jgi:hypothetical protein
MLRTFIFDESKSQWVEEEQRFLSQDICAILDEENIKLYLWNGPKSKKKKFRKAYKQLKLLAAKYPELHIQLILSKKNFPMQIQNKLESFLDSMSSTKEKKLKFSRFTTIRIYSISIIISTLLPVLSFLNLNTSLFWTRYLGNFEVNNIIYANWINFSKIIALVSLIFFSVNLLIGIIENENQVIIFSINSIIILIGVAIYLNQGVFLFLFQEGSTPTTYFILPRDIFIFLFLNLTALLIFEIPNIYKLVSFFKTYRKFIF